MRFDPGGGFTPGMIDKWSVLGGLALLCAACGSETVLGSGGGGGEGGEGGSDSSTTSATSTTSAGGAGPTEACANLEDDDDDGLVDCLDADCAEACADSCANVIWLDALPLGTTRTFALSSEGWGDLSDGTCVSGSGGPEVIVGFYPEDFGVLYVNVDGADDFALSVRGACENDVAETACVDDTLGGGTEQLAFPLNAFAYTYLMIERSEASAVGEFQLSFEIPEPSCDAATDLQVPAVVVGSTEGGSSDLVFCDEIFVGQGMHWNPQQVYRVVAPADGNLNVKVTPGLGFDADIAVRSACDSAVDERCSYGGSEGQVEALTIPVEAGDVRYIVVQGYALDLTIPPAMGPFTIESSLDPAQCGDSEVQGGEQCDSSHPACVDCSIVLGETEPNGSVAQADSHAAGMAGAIDPAGDADYYAVTIPGPTSTLTATVVSGPRSQCGPVTQPAPPALPIPTIDSVLWLYGPDGTTQLAFDDEIGGGNSCSELTVTGLAAGKYYLRVQAFEEQPQSPTRTFDYGLDVTVQ
jgi:hypothetical protein